MRPLAYVLLVLLLSVLFIVIMVAIDQVYIGLNSAADAMEAPELVSEDVIRALSMVPILFLFALILAMFAHSRRR